MEPLDIRGPFSAIEVKKYKATNKHGPKQAGGYSLI
jgi:hypothetical protein